MSEKGEIDKFFERSRLTLDLIGLSESQKEEGSVLLGGSAAEFVGPDDEFEYDEINSVVFRWGDSKIEDTFSILLEHKQAPAINIFDFSASTVIQDELWSLVLQDKDWSPELAYEKEKHYVVLPFDENEAQSVILDTFAKYPIDYESGLRRPEILGKIGSRYLLFEMATNIEGNDTRYNNPQIEHNLSLLDNFGSNGENIGSEKAIDQIERAVNMWDFENSGIEFNDNLALQLSYWALETFGSKWEGEFVLYSGSDKNIEGSKLPLNLQHLLTHTWQNDLIIGNNNSINLSSKDEFIESDHVFPRQDEIDQIVPIMDKIEFIRANPDILNNIQLAVVEVLHQANIVFEPSHFDGWGLDFVVSTRGIQVLPFGKPGKTEPATNFAFETRDNPKELAKTVCGLVILALRNAHSRDDISVESIETFKRRLTGEEEIPINKEPFISKSSNAIKNLIISELMKSGDIEFPL